MTFSLGSYLCTVYLLDDVVSYCFFGNLNQMHFFHCWLQRLVRELDSVSKQLAAAKRDHETETVKRLDCENRLKTIQSELSLQSQVHKKVMQQTDWLL